MSDKDETDGCGCIILCMGIAIILFAFLHGCAAVIRAFH
jgi:hypothetical protein